MSDRSGGESNNKNWVKREDTVLTNPRAWFLGILSCLVVGTMAYNILRFLNVPHADPIGTAAGLLSIAVVMWYEKPLPKQQYQ